MAFMLILLKKAGFYLVPLLVKYSILDLYLYLVVFLIKFVHSQFDSNMSILILD